MSEIGELTENKVECFFCKNMRGKLPKTYDSRIAFQIWNDANQGRIYRSPDAATYRPKDRIGFSESLFVKLADASSRGCAKNIHCIQREILEIAFNSPEVVDGKALTYFETRLSLYNSYLEGLKDLQARRTALNSLFLTIHSGSIGAMFLIMKEISMPREHYVDCIPLLLGPPVLGLVMAFFWLVVADYYSGKISDKVRISRMQERWFPVRALWYEKMSTLHPLIEDKTRSTPTKNLVYFGFPLYLICFYFFMISSILAIPIDADGAPLPVEEAIVAVFLISWLAKSIRSISEWSDGHYADQMKAFVVCFISLLIFGELSLRSLPECPQFARNTLNAIYLAKQPKAVTKEGGNNGVNDK